MNENIVSNFSNKCIVFVGAAGAVGSLLSEEFINYGTKVILVDRDYDNLRRILEDSHESLRANVGIFQCDLESIENRRELFSKIQKENSRIDGIVNCAAFVGDTNLPGWNVPFSEQSISTWRRAIEVNLTSVFEVCQILVPSLELADDPSIVNISSIYGEKGPKWDLYKGTTMGSPAAYGVSKAGLNQLTRWLSTTLAPKIRVNTIVAGGIERNQPQHFVKRYCRDVPLGRMAKERDLLGPVIFLLSSMSNYITGETLHVDGGRGVW